MAVTCNQRVYHLADRDKGEGYAVVVFERTPRLPAKKNAPDPEDLSQESKLRKEI